MTDEQIAMRSWLNRAFYAEKKLTALTDKCKRDRERAERVTQMYGGIDKGKSDSHENGTQKLMDALMDSIEECDKYAKEYASIRREIETEISTLTEPVTEAIFIHRHINYLSMEGIAEVMHYDRATIQRKYKDGLKKLLHNATECNKKM